MAPSASPSSPTRRRRSSQFSGRITPVASHSRHNSQSQPSSPSSHRRMRTLSRTLDGPDADPVASATQQQSGGANGLESLADELANAWDDNADDSEDEAADTSQISESNLTQEQTAQQSTQNGTHPADDAPPHTSPSSTTTSPIQSQSTPKTSRPRRHTRTRSRYDGSEYGGYDDSPTGRNDFPPELSATMAEIEHLAAHGPSPNDAGNDVVPALLASLRDLGGQAALEAHATRLITAHTSLSMHVTHQTRTLQALALPLVSPLGAGLDAAAADELAPLLEDCAAALPQPSFTSLNSLSHLGGASRDVLASLAGLADSLHLVRQMEGTAARRLKSAREAVGEMRAEWERAGQGERWIEDGRWGERLKRRECASVCRDVVGGFEEVCNGWRERLVRSAQQAEAVAV